MDYNYKKIPKFQLFVDIIVFSLEWENIIKGKKTSVIFEIILGTELTKESQNFEFKTG